MQVEVEVLQPLWFDGKPVVLEEGKAAPVIAMGKADAVYLQSIGRVRLIEADEAKPKKAAKK